MESSVAGLIGALTGSAAVILGQWLSNHYQKTRTKEEWNRQRKLKLYDDTRNVYIDVIAGFEKSIRFTQRMMDYAELFEELSRLNARMQLSAPKAVLTQYTTTSEKLFEWSSAYRQGAPKKVAGTEYSVWGSSDFPQVERARELYPSLCQQIIELTNLMKTHLSEIEV